MNETEDELPEAGWYPDPQRKGVERRWSGTEWTDERRGQGVLRSGITGAAVAGTTSSVGTNAETSRAGLGIASVGVVLAVISVFLPHLETDTFAAIVDNTMIQNGLGWGILIVCAFTTLGLYRRYTKGGRGISVIVFGLLTIAYAGFAGTGDRTELESTGPFAGSGVHDTASPGVGIYAAGLGGAIMVLGGLMIAGYVGAQPDGPSRTDGNSKRCPDCAESVLTDAKVCKHCGFRFEPSPDEAQQIG